MTHATQPIGLKTHKLSKIFILVTFLGLSMLVPPSVEARPICASVHHSAENAFLSARESLRQDLSRENEALNAMKLDPREIVLIDYLGAGFSGSVYKVKYRNKEYALKVFYKIDRLGEVDEGKLNERSGAVLIQKALGHLGLAPQVTGILDKERTHFWIRNLTGITQEWEQDQDPSRKKRVAPNKQSDFAILMELVDDRRSLKTGRNFNLIQSARLRALSQAEKINSILNRLNVQADDLDAIVSERGDLKLIDLSYYRVRSEEQPPNEYAKKALTFMIQKVPASETNQGPESPKNSEPPRSH